MANENEVKASDFTFSTWELNVDEKVYVLELSNEAVKDADRLYPVSELTKKGIVEQIEIFIRIFTSKNHKYLSAKDINYITNYIIDNKMIEDVLPELQAEYIKAYEMVFTSGVADKKKKSILTKR